MHDMYKKVQDIAKRHHSIPVLTVVIMASYQNTSGYYCGITMNPHPGHCPNPDIYFNQNPTNFHTPATAYYPENYVYQEVNPKIFSGGSIYNPTDTHVIYNNGDVHAHTRIPQYNPNQNIPHTQGQFHQEPRPRFRNQTVPTKHHAQITILPSSKGNFKAQIKRKRKRTMFTTEQVAALEKIFQSQQYVSRDERLAIVNQLNLSDKSVKIWFQNRRLKVKNIDKSEEQHEESCYPKEEERIARINSLEAEIIKRTNANGFVSLDGELMRELVNVIDESLTRNGANIPVKEIGESDSNSPYEPVSPASVIDNDVDSSLNWSPSEPDESLKRLFELQTMLIL